MKRWPCWLLGGHRYGGVERGWFVCRRCGRGYRAYAGGVAP